MNNLPRMPEAKTPPIVNNVYVTEKRAKVKDGGILDIFLTALIVVLMVGIIAAYFVTFNVEVNVDVKEATVNTIWFAVGNFAIGALSKKLLRSKGEKTDRYKEAEKEANDEIKALCDSKYAKYADAYCKDYTTQAIARYREYQLSLVGLSLETFAEKYLGIGLGALTKEWRRKAVSLPQVRAIWRCNHVKMHAYNPNFILSYNAAPTDTQSPSEMYDTRRTNAFNTFKSVVTVLLSAFGVGFMFSDIILNFSLVVLFTAIIKTIMIGINIGLKASFGWNLAQMEIKRNKLRASEAKACRAWAEKYVLESNDEKV